MKRMIVEPEGWECPLSECPPGLFVFNEDLCFKTEYGTMQVFCESGEIFWGGVESEDERKLLMVQPVKVMFENYNA